MRILLNIAYDGTNYCGWQKQKDERTVQGEIEKGLYKIYKYPIGIIGASRTDSGVHAQDQIATFDIKSTQIPPDRLKMVLNKKLPDDIRIINSKELDYDFFPLVHVKNKTYQYHVDRRRIYDPLFYRYSYNFKTPLDIDKIKKASEFLVGTKDFASFTNIGGKTSNTVRTINYIKIIENNDILTIEINGDGFLYNMVRIIVGTLLYVGADKFEVDFVKDILEGKDRKLAGKTAPARGLILYKVNI